MFNHHSVENPYQIVLVVLVIVFLLMILGPIASAYDQRTTYPKSLDDISYAIYRPSVEEISLSSIRNYLRENGWVKDYVDDDQLDYILVLTRQLSTHYENIDPNLITAMIAVESRFDTNANNHGARGLVQLMPMYHEDRLIQFIEEDERYSRDLFYDPRLNIMTAMDYMSYILETTNGDLDFALMWYNQGAVSAFDEYELNGHTSYYAASVQKLANKLDQLTKT